LLSSYGNGDHHERASRTAELFGQFNPHQSQLEELRGERRVHLAGLFHGADPGADLRFGEVGHGGAEEGFFLGEDGQRGGEGGVRHES